MAWHRAKAAKLGRWRQVDATYGEPWRLCLVELEKEAGTARSMCRGTEVGPDDYGLDSDTH
ncbi:hypothetical protein E2562_031787 [Oryza meyeriana var. granulata]|uniref:Uncharacterized protein n=1 Tax=Oryza meyeriana var. granulata TaxID=110450 RepID=A0A6G1ECZ9_9ORYZ|nr:hypothetical protein E2562_031787 [Oryza meyeriana var. granulata]